MDRMFLPFQEKGLDLKNRIVMAPMTRSRAIGNLPNDLMAEYYGQRTGAGLIVTEGTAPAPEGLGYSRIPGIFSPEQVEGWKKVTETVHRTGSRIFVQLMHTGRIAHVANLPEGASVVGASVVKAAGQIHTDALGMQPHSDVKALSTEGVRDVVAQFVQAAKNAVKAGFDGIELHAANGYLLEQFLNPNVNDRADEYGGSIPNRTRLIVEIAEAAAHAIGAKKVGVRVSPYSVNGDLQPYGADEVHETYAYLAKALDAVGIAYIHLSVNTEIPVKTTEALRNGFSGAFILCGGLTPEKAEAALREGRADLVAFGRPFLANPDFVGRAEIGALLNQPDFSTAFTPGPKGYVDYPVLEETHR